MIIFCLTSIGIRIQTQDHSSKHTNIRTIPQERPSIWTDLNHLSKEFFQKVRFRHLLLLIQRPLVHYARMNHLFFVFSSFCIFSLSLLIACKQGTVVFLQLATDLHICSDTLSKKKTHIINLRSIIGRFGVLFWMHEIASYSFGIPFAIKIIRIANQDCFDYHRQWNGFCHS